MSYTFSKRSIERLEGVDPSLISVFQLALKLSRIDFGIPENGGLRTTEIQQGLYAQGRTEPGDIITRTDGVIKKSKHQGGKAIDVYAYINGRASWKPVHLALIAGAVFAAAKQLGIKIRWGGTFGSSDFAGWDSAHYQLR